MSAFRYFVPPVAEVLADRLPRSNATEAEELRQILEFTLDREAFAANVIQGLSYRIDCNSELSQRARNYAFELRHYIARLKALLPVSVCPASDDPPLRGTPKRTIEGLEADEARLVLINFLSRHAESTCWMLSSGAEESRSRALEMLRRRAERERHKIALWIGEVETTLRPSPDWHTRRM